MLARVSLAASRLQLRGQDVFVLHTSQLWSRSEGGWNESENEHPIESSRVDLVSPSFEQDTHAIALALGTTVAFRKLLPEKTLTASPPWDTSSTVGGWSFCFQEPLDRSFVSASKADTVPVSQELRVRRNHECQQTRCNISVPSSSPQTRPSR
jgi:hypothetical protein